MKNTARASRISSLRVLAVATAMASAFLSGCVDSVGPPPSQRTSAVGEPTSDGFPSPAERLGLMAINRARSDPQTVKGTMSASYPARPPVIYSDPLSHSAHFHAVNLEMADVTLMHSSPCPLNTDVATSGCSGDPACACATPVPSMCASCAQVDAENSCGTAPFTRIGYFTAGTNVSATGEVAAAGYSNPMTTVDGWMDEPSSSDGHRKILTDQGTSANTMGYGHAAGKNCYSTFDVGDSGNLKNAVIPKLPTAAVSPFTGAAGAFTFYATWADPAMGAPASLNVVIDGACTAMTRELGTDTLNATYKATSTLAAGCHSYYVAATDGGGAALTYPTTGALTVSVGSVACDADYLAEAPASACSAGGGGGATGSGGAVATGTGGTTGAAGAGGKAGTGGVRGATGGATTSGGGTRGSGGAPGSGSGGAASSGGAPGSGGVSNPGTGGTTTSSGGGVHGSGGASGTGGATSGSGSGGNTSSGSGSGGAKDATGSGGGGGPAVAGSGSVSSGCNCDVATPPPPSLSIGLFSLALLTLARRRRGSGRRMGR
jgi:MYXO-CTERM domain-containing protein